MGSGRGKSRRVRASREEMITQLREEKPRVMHTEGREEWRLSNGWAHREDGPAIISADGEERWCLYGSSATQEEVEEYVREREETRKREVKDKAWASTTSRGRRRPERGVLVHSPLSKFRGGAGSPVTWV